MRRRPKQAVMYHEQVRSGGASELHGGETGVHGGGDAGHAAGVFDLQTVRGARVIAEGSGAEQGVAVLGDRAEGSIWHGGMKPEAAAGENFFVPANCFLRATFYSAVGLNLIR
jgi:hypothetical protein